MARIVEYDSWFDDVFEPSVAQSLVERTGPDLVREETVLNRQEREKRACRGMKIV